VSHTLKINEIFYSLQGEGRWAGTPVTFLRVAGCSLGCEFCDTKDAWENGKEMTIPEVLAALEEFPLNHLVITGGEPFERWEALNELICELDPELFLQVETNGHHLEELEEFVGMGDTWATVSPKPGFDEFTILEADEVKWLVGDMVDVGAAELAWHWIDSHSGGLDQFPHFYLQPISQDPVATQLCIEACLEHPDKFKLSVQLHKYLEIK